MGVDDHAKDCGRRVRVRGELWDLRCTPVLFFVLFIKLLKCNVHKLLT